MRLGHSLCSLLALVPDVTSFYFVVSSSEVSSQKTLRKTLGSLSPRFNILVAVRVQYCDTELL